MTPQTELGRCHCGICVRKGAMKNPGVLGLENDVAIPMLTKSTRKHCGYFPHFRQRLVLSSFLMLETAADKT